MLELPNKISNNYQIIYSRSFQSNILPLPLMRKVLFIFFLGLFCLNGFAQDLTQRPDRSNGMYQSDSTKNNTERTVKIDGITKYTDYKIISVNNDTTIIDTTLTIQKQYKHNYLRKDNFELMAFGNQGQTYNKLGYSFQGSPMFPQIGFNAKQYNFYSLNDLHYYYVPTPTSELMYKKGVQQGQVLDALLTANTSKQLNVSLAYKGLRSLGRYQNELADHGNLRATFNYHTKNKRYYVRGHLYGFSLENEENGGLTPQSIIYFETNNPDYSDRERLEVNFNDASNMFEGKRYYLDQVVTLFSNRSFDKKSNSKQVKAPTEIPKIGEKQEILTDSTQQIKTIDEKSINIDSLTVNEVLVENDSVLFSERKVLDSTAIVMTPVKIDSSLVVDTLDKPLFNLKLGNSIMYQTVDYRFYQEDENDYFGDAFVDASFQDHTSYQNFDGQLYLELYSIYTGSLKFKTNYFNYNYFYNSILFLDNATVSNKLKGDAVSIGAEWVKTFGDLQLRADASTILFGDINGNTLKTAISYKLDSVFNLQGFAEFTSKTPDFNKLLYQSNYKDYNWQNNFGNEKIVTFGGAFNTQKWGSIEASYNAIDNYTYFNENSQAEQASETLNYFKVKLLKEFTYGKFSLDNTVMYQNVISGDSFFRVPTWVTRNTLYFATDVFKGKPLYLQTGVTFSYFSSYKMNAYNPLISEFYIQNTDEIGNFPVFDFFFNMRIQRTRFYLQFENFAAALTGRNYYSAPTMPYRDFTFRIGLVWNFFI